MAGSKLRDACLIAHDNKALWYKAGSWSAPRRIIARIEASTHPDPTPDRPDGMRQKIDVRYVVTSLEGDPERLYEGVYCQRGQMVG